jgi:cold shock CspA family protein
VPICVTTSTGTVVDFDEHRGYGKVRAADGRELFFHCTAIADGSRRIPVGTEVVFAVVPGHRGMWEAADVEARPLPLTAERGP